MTYSYDGSGGLVKRTDSSKNTSTVYAGGMEQTFSGSTLTGTTKYYAFEGQTVAMRKDGVVSYLLRDHLGSASIVVNQSGAVVATTKYWPFGLTREQTGVMPTDKLFTGQQKEQDDVLDLYNYGARFYSAALGRFMGVDPVVPSVGDQQAWNPYAYVRNNPLMYVDPTGMRWTDDGGGDCDLECQQENDPYYQEAATQDWVEAPAMEPYEPCVQCLILIAAAIAYEQAAQVAAWAAAAPVTNPDSYEQQKAFYAQSQQQSDTGDRIQTGAMLAGTTIVAAETLDPAPLDPLAWVVGGGVALSGAGIGWLASEATAGGEPDVRPVVIGENQQRVIAYAEAHGLDYYHSWRSHGGFFMQQNAEWLEHDVMARSRTIVDIGPAPGNKFYPDISSPYYQMERDMIEDRKYPYYVQAATYGQ
jgi:RHS repeat-associated protein